jgi:nucleotide-binding universal stress UspA family protein
MERIVVGVDGSDESRAALRWALAEAQLRHASLEVVHVWEPAYAGAYPFAMPPYDVTAIEHGARTLVESMLEHEDLSGLGAPVVRTIVCGSAAAVLIERSAGAAIVAVGARGHGGFSRLLLGSTSTQLVHHARCPVVVVRH